jgi:hypothetical protein
MQAFILVIFFCSVSGSSNTFRRYVEDDVNQKQLYITEIDSSDEGTYKCVQPDGKSQPSEKTVALKLYSKSKYFAFRFAVSFINSSIILDLHPTSSIMQILLAIAGYCHWPSPAVANIMEN